MKMRWRSFGRREGVTIGTLFFLAQEAGWRPILAEPETTPEFILNGKLTGWAPTPSKKTVIHKESVRIVSETKKVDQMQFPKELLKAPGLPGTLSDFIDRTSLMPQPILGLGAAIAAAGALMGRKVRGDTNIRTNMYVHIARRTPPTVPRNYHRAVLIDDAPVDAAVALKGWKSGS